MNGAADRAEIYPLLRVGVLIRNLMSRNPHIERLRLNGEVREGGYAASMLLDTMGFAIPNTKGPMILDIHVRWDDAQAPGIAVTFTPKEGEAKTVLLPRGGVEPLLRERLKRQTAYQQGVVGRRPVGDLNDLESAVSAQHDQAANWMERFFLSQGITTIGERRAMKSEGEPHQAASATACLIGLMTEAMKTELRSTPVPANKAQR